MNALSVEPRTAERKIASYRQAGLLTPGAAGHLVFASEIK